MGRWVMVRHGFFCDIYVHLQHLICKQPLPCLFALTSSGFRCRESTRSSVTAGWHLCTWKKKKNILCDDDNEMNPPPCICVYVHHVNDRSELSYRWLVKKVCWLHSYEEITGDTAKLLAVRDKSWLAHCGEKIASSTALCSTEQPRSVCLWKFCHKTQWELGYINMLVWWGGPCLAYNRWSYLWSFCRICKSMLTSRRLHPCFFFHSFCFALFVARDSSQPFVPLYNWRIIRTDLQERFCTWKLWIRKP